jgi:hypothetical protein
VSASTRPAFYALAPGGWRDYVTLLHPPYTLWHLAYLTIGASLAPTLEAERLAWGLVAFFLGLGVGAHALDELNGRPLRTRIPTRVLIGIAVASLGAAAAIGTFAALAWNLWLLAFAAVGIALAVGYNLELFGGRLHGDLWFPLAWGAFPVLTGYFGAAETLRVEALLAAGFATALSAAQRELSTRVRTVRREAASISGEITYADGRREPLDADALVAAPERALKATAVAVVVLAVAMAVMRLAE